ncbi:MAG: hypothetical protein HFI71_13000 [Lachnospiraceae bacterium]|nr:hypothetical protein [Lachnospiraceae bacterium]
MGFIYMILIILYFVVVLYGFELRKGLKKMDYWKSLPTGTAVFGYCLPVLILILLNHIGFIRISISILLVIVFISCVVGLNNNLKEQPLQGFSSPLPEEDRKKVVTFYTLTPLLSILVLCYIGLVLDLLFKISDYQKRKRR